MSDAHNRSSPAAPIRSAEIDDPPRAAAQRWGAILWPSFFAAGIATIVFFAMVDPDDLRQITWAEIELSREGGYTIGFFMFWACTFASSLFTWMLLRTPIQGRRRGQPLDGNEPVSPNASSALPEHGGGSKRVP